MSIVIAKKVKNGFILAADSICISGQERGKATKLFKLDRTDDVYIGGVGTLNDINIVTVMEDLIDPNAVKRGCLDLKSITTYTLPNLRKQLAEYGNIDSKDGRIAWDSEIIIAYKDKAFVIDSSFCPIEIEDFCAIGAPEDFAKGAYAVLQKFPQKKINDKEIIKEIIKMTIEKTTYVFYPIIIIDTSKEKHFTEIKGGIVEYEDSKI